jgi:hypothetical protein
MASDGVAIKNLSYTLLRSKNRARSDGVGVKKVVPQVVQLLHLMYNLPQVV